MHAMGKSPALPLYYLLLITLVAFYLLIVSSNAIPLSRVQRLPLQESSDMPLVRGISTAKPKIEMERSIVIPGEDVVINARVALETQDYPPSGPNNHHKPPGWS
ncbi:uncharacterized protein LOC102711559 [Oryza brachyantha]|uniref:Uncharacterized protein n=1 Tax=Oryza brachyantha TaxID=4533 RepID=J3MXE1_ORYBR|nr:uncharacterized protein LOC102711559 [Oryza brachyantha]